MPSNPAIGDTLLTEALSTNGHRSHRSNGRPEYDVAVVGASGAGLRAAHLLAMAGRRVAVLDARARPGALARTWIVTRQIGPVLGFDPRGAVVHRTGVMRMAARDVTCQVALDPPDLIVERSRLLPLLAGRAVEAGAELRRGARVTDLRPARGRIELEVQGLNGGRPKTLRARHVIGADGVSSDVGRAFGASRLPTVPIVQAIVRLPDGWDPDVTQVWFEPETTRYFYWLIPHAPDEGVLGLVADRRADARRTLDDFLARRGLEPLEYQAAMIPLHRPRRRVEWRVSGARVLLVGDAAGHVKTTTVGGVVTGLWGAEAAARAILNGRSYRRELRDLNRELYFHALIRRALHRFGPADYDRLLGSLNGELTGLLARQNRDSMAPKAVELFRAQPRVLWMGARAMLRRPYRTGRALAVARQSSERERSSVESLVE